MSITENQITSAIEQSAQHNEIIHLTAVSAQDRDEIYGAISAALDDSDAVEVNSVLEVTGTDDDGNNIRIHVSLT